MNGIQPNQNPVPFQIFEGEPQNENIHLVVRLDAGEPEEEIQIEDGLEEPFYYKALDELGEILLSYQNDDIMELDYLSLRILHWGKESLKLHLEGIDTIEEVFKKQLKVLMSEILVISHGNPFKLPVIYEEVILENEFALEYIKYCVPNPAVLKIHDFAVEIIKWSEPVMEFIFSQGEGNNPNLNVGLQPINNRRVLPEQFKHMYYNSTFNHYKSSQILNLIDIRKIVNLDIFIKDAKAMKIFLSENSERLKKDLALHEIQIEERFAASEKDYLDTIKPVKEQLGESQKTLLETGEKLYRAQVHANSLQGAVYALRAENQQIRERIEHERRRDRSGCTIL